MKKGTICFFLMCLAIFAAFPATGNAVAVKDGVVTLRLAHVNPPGSPTDMAVTKLKELLHQRTDGKVALKVFPNEQLGAEKAALEGVVLGTIDCSLNDAAYLADLYPAMGVLDFPYTYLGWDHYRKVIESPDFRELADVVYDKVGIKVIAPFLFGRRMLCSNRPVSTPQDAKGLKIRTPPSELAMENARVLGGIPTTISYTEAYMGLKQGVADAAENPFTGIYDMKWYEVTKYLVITEHVWNNEILSVSKKAWSALSPEQQKAFMECGIEAAKYRMDIQKDLEKGRMEELKKLGMQVIEPASLDPFRSLAADIQKKYREKYEKEQWGKWHERIKALDKK